MSNNPLPAEEIHGNLYPYVNTKLNFFNPLLNDIRRGVSSINPFAIQQVPTQERAAFGLRYGNQFYYPDVYPNGISFERMFPTHYDPLKELNRTRTSWQIHAYAPGPHSILALTADKLPRGCVRTLQAFQRCQMVNGDSKCQEEKQEIVDVCPNWSLDAMKEKTRFLAKVGAIQNQQYRKAMNVSDYNKGREVSDVSDKNWIHGTRQYLRPDTMWADERYAKITQKDVNEAKARIAERERQKVEQGHPAKSDELKKPHHYDFKHVAVKQPKQLYP